MSKKLRLVKVIAQAHFVIDDGDALTELTSEPISVTAADWPEYPARLKREMADHEKKLNEEE